MAPIILTVIGVLLVSPTVSWAYVDPNTVGFASQFLAPFETLSGLMPDLLPTPAERRGFGRLAMAEATTACIAS